MQTHANRKQCLTCNSQRGNLGIVCSITHCIRHFQCLEVTMLPKNVAGVNERKETVISKMTKGDVKSALIIQEAKSLTKHIHKPSGKQPYPGLCLFPPSQQRIDLHVFGVLGLVACRHSCAAETPPEGAYNLPDWNQQAPTAGACDTRTLNANSHRVSKKMAVFVTFLVFLEF